MRTQLALALASMAVHVPAAQWNAQGGAVRWFVEKLNAVPQEAALPCLLELLIVLPQVWGCVENNTCTKYLNFCCLAANEIGYRHKSVRLTWGCFMPHTITRTKLCETRPAQSRGLDRLPRAPVTLPHAYRKPLHQRWR